MRSTGTIRTFAAAAALLVAGAAHAQNCDDFNPCTSNDMCSEGFCTGAFVDMTCDDNDPCTGDDRCQVFEGGAVCRGEAPGQEGAPCSGGCGTCQAIAPVPGLPLQCLGDPANNDDPCDVGDDNPCFEGRCQIFPEPANIALCFPDIKECPDTDGNLCNDACDFNTGECEGNAIKCDPNCETCNASSGVCEPANLGGACDDFNLCSPESRCETIDEIGRTFCLPGEATGPTPTPTAEPGACVGDCNNNNQVAINELILGVSISLGNGSIDQCLAFDRNDSGGIEINELVGGVSASLNGCV
jgi:hypothetical protein